MRPCQENTPYQRFCEHCFSWLPCKTGTSRQLPCVMYRCITAQCGIIHCMGIICQGLRASSRDLKSPEWARLQHWLKVEAVCSQPFQFLPVQLLLSKTWPFCAGLTSIHRKAPLAGVFWLRHCNCLQIVEVIRQSVEVVLGSGIYLLLL